MKSSLLLYMLVFCMGLLMAIPPAASQTRPSPASAMCHREDLAMREAVTNLISPDRQANGLPTRWSLAMDSDALDDARYASGDWIKIRYVRIDRVNEHSPISGNTVVITRYHLVIHAMWNTVTKQWEDVKFKNSVGEGCIGEQVSESDPVTPDNLLAHCTAGGEGGFGSQTITVTPVYQNGTVCTPSGCETKSYLMGYSISSSGPLSPETMQGMVCT
jgi:hypothetical protein